jgi:signal transduction histidine kinase
MKLLRKIFFPHKLKSKIILTFTFVSVIIVAATARISYLFVKDIYLEQLTEQVNLYVKSISLQFDDSYLRTLPFGNLSPSSLEYFRNVLNKNIINSSVQEAFVFDYNFKLIAHTNAGKKLNAVESRLLLNKSEIDALDINSSIASLPFKGKDNNWYMWGFLRLSDNYWLGVRESAARLEKVERFAVYFWVIGIGGILLTIVAGLIVADRIVNPINKLVEFSRQIGSRNFDVKIPGANSGEINILAEAMDTMKNGLKKHHREKEEMLARIAHEIRNPLGGIELLASLTKEDLIKEGKNPGYINQILEEIAGLKELITSYLNYGKPLNPSPEWCSLDKTISEIENIFDKRLREKNINFTVTKNIEKVWFDAAQFRNVLINLVSNSIDSIDNHGTIWLNTESENGHSKIYIKDSGNGINMKYKKNIFEPFFTTKKNGTGLGLAICKKLCEENNASLLLQESEDPGTCFLIKVNNNL